MAICGVAVTDVKTYFRSAETTDVWLTPPALVKALGLFTLDPCAPEVAPFRHAPIWYTEKHDGLVQPWFGRVFMNPPYGSQTGLFMRKLADHGDGIALVFARVETKWFREQVWKRADAVMFFASRISFLRADGSSGQGSSAPSCLVAYGSQNVIALHTSGLSGTIIDLKNGAVTL